MRSTVVEVTTRGEMQMIKSRMSGTKPELCDRGDDIFEIFLADASDAWLDARQPFEFFLAIVSFLRSVDSGGSIEACKMSPFALSDVPRAWKRMRNPPTVLLCVLFSRETECLTLRLNSRRKYFY